MPENRNINKELESLRQKAQTRGITEEDIENEIKAHRAGSKKKTPDGRKKKSDSGDE